LRVTVARTAGGTHALLAQNGNQGTVRKFGDAGLVETVIRAAPGLGVISDLLVVLPRPPRVARFERANLPSFSYPPRSPDRHEQAPVLQFQNVPVGDRLAHFHLNGRVALPGLATIIGSVNVGRVAALLAARLFDELLVKRPENRSIAQPRDPDFGV